MRGAQTSLMPILFSRFAHLQRQDKRGKVYKNVQLYKVPPAPSYLTIAAATIPDDFMTAFYTLFDCLELVPPAFPISVPPPHAETPILVYGAGAMSDQYAVRLLALAGYKRVIATASPRHHSYLRSLGAAHVVDHSAEDMPEKIPLAAGRNKNLQFVLDCISAEGTLKSISGVVSSDGVVPMLSPVTEGSRHITGKTCKCG
ncbi:hypothetical protein EV702DRAFT_76879 [Suillus placidus]|uniref:Alcohol dehydrogenase-like C-terminal domain-containing protein n=1 Tax=Suillus placidus TaxID=48579 RepID=A0A9P7A0M9_9AGAM|nr:hypothetical protein EV702DRAFT_76879 [Suillus placidus]